MGDATRPRRISRPSPLPAGQRSGAPRGWPPGDGRPPGGVPGDAVRGDGVSPGARRHAGSGRPDSSGRKARTGPPRRLGLLLMVACAIYVTDLISKAVVVATLSPGHRVRLLGGIVTLRVLRNSGAAFSVGTSMTIVFTLIAVGVIVFILRTSRRLRSLPWAVTLGLLLGGATGNLTDRLLRSPGVFRGEVVDWIQVPHWPVFNIADSAIVCGGVLAVLLAARGIRLDGGKDGRPPGDHPGADDPPGRGNGRPAGDSQA